MMSTEEKSRILRMVAEGTVSAEEAADLLDALEPRVEPRAPSALSPMASMMVQTPPRRTLVIQVSDHGKNVVNVRIPLGLAKAAGKFIPRQAQEYLENYDISIKDILDSIGNTD